MVYEPGESFEIAEAKLLRDGKDATIIACGSLVWEALVAAWHCAEHEGLDVAVLDMHTVKPLDDDAVVAAAKRTGAIVTAEEHLLDGGVGSRVGGDSALSRSHVFVGLKNTYAESGTPEQLFDRYGLTSRHIVDAILRLV